METTKEFFKISVALSGVKKRCRKIDFHVLRGGCIDYNGGVFDRESIETLARELVDSNIKQVMSSVIIHLDYVKLGEFMQTWEPLSNKNIRWELKTPLEIELS